MSENDKRTSAVCNNQFLSYSQTVSTVNMKRKRPNNEGYDKEEYNAW